MFVVVGKVSNKKSKYPPLSKGEVRLKKRVKREG